MRIVKIESALPMDGEYWLLEKETSYLSGFFITEIRDMTVKTANGVHSQYDIYANGKLYKSIINMPVKVEYALKD